MRSTAWKIIALGCAAFAIGCAAPEKAATEPDGVSSASNRFENSDWSAPIHLPAPINSAFRELSADLSHDELSLYFNSDRPGLGGFDIWVSRRECRECPWQSPTNLGAGINSSAGDGGVALSDDGHLMFFSGARAGGLGGEDIWVTHRVDTNDDLAWEAPVNLGPLVNTAANEAGTAYTSVGAGDNLYFSRDGDIYSVGVDRFGMPTGPASAVAELNHPIANDAEPTIRHDGKEIVFWSNSPRGGLGGTDLWVSTRRTPNDPWGAPQNLTAANSPFAQLSPGLSSDGRTLFVAYGFGGHGGLGFQDIWMLTRRESR